MRTGRMKDYMKHSESGVRQLAGKVVEILEVDEGEGWEPPITKVRRGGEAVWVKSKDLEHGN